MRRAKVLSWLILLVVGSRLSLALALGHFKQGDRVANFAVSTIDGSQLSLDALKGKIIVLAFWKKDDEKSSKVSRSTPTASWAPRRHQCG